ncbi:MAG: hypothetical protein LBG26_07095, partial [Treponema sp.]|nr:hypothetical protein [Treponema sp.]
VSVASFTRFVLQGNYLLVGSTTNFLLVLPILTALKGGVLDPTANKKHQGEKLNGKSYQNRRGQAGRKIGETRRQKDSRSQAGKIRR